MSRSLRSTPIAEEVACPACGRRTRLTVTSMIVRIWFCERCREYRKLHAAADEVTEPSPAAGCTEGAAARYRQLLAERTLARSLAPGGELDQDEELAFAEALDLSWDEMSAEERVEAEHRFAAAKAEDAAEDAPAVRDPS